MPRREFTKATRGAVIKRATRDDVIYCEDCSLPCKRFQIDHIRADGLLGEPVLENAQLLCEVCFGVKNPADASAIARAKRIEARHIGADRPKSSIPSRPKQARPVRDKPPPLPRKPLFAPKETAQ